MRPGRLWTLSARPKAPTAAAASPGSGRRTGLPQLHMGRCAASGLRDDGGGVPPENDQAVSLLGQGKQLIRELTAEMEQAAEK